MQGPIGPTAVQLYSRLASQLLLLRTASKPRSSYRGATS
jgi:hypothetical protein